jgi:hypothetical protein
MRTLVLLIIIMREENLSINIIIMRENLSINNDYYEGGEH